MTKEMIKAVRMVRGFTSDLRVCLCRTGCVKNDLENWLFDNRFGIFGVGIASEMTMNASADPCGYAKTMRILHEASYEVMTGKAGDL